LKQSTLQRTINYVEYNLVQTSLLLVKYPVVIIICLYIQTFRKDVSTAEDDYPLLSAKQLIALLKAVRTTATLSVELCDAAEHCAAH